MKLFNRLIGGATALAMITSLGSNLLSPVSVYAATAPNLGVASGYAVFGNAGTTNNSAVGTTHVWGNVGGNGLGNTNLSDATQVDGTIDAGANVPVVGAISAAYGDLAGEALTQIPILDLDIINTVGPGVYDIGVGATFTNTLTLNGAGVYIFRSAGGTVAQTAGGTMVLTGGASACNVYWQIADAMTFGAAPASIAGTIITNTANITFVDGVTLQGRAWAATQVTMINNQITEPVCAATSSGGSSNTFTGTISVVKNVINDNGGTKVVSDFPLFVNSIPVTSGMTNTYPANSTMYTVSETNDAGYTHTFSGDCDADGVMYLHASEHLFCIMTNNDIGPAVVVPPVPPVIDVVKVPNPLALPLGPGLVEYTYTVRNIGTVPMTNVTLVGDTCSPIVLSSGDTNNNATLETTEVWTYHCSTTLNATHTNTVVATGWANGLSATDIASATVVVGIPTVPPLIHVTKVPSPLALHAGGGAVLYTEKITNPGIVALSNVTLVDDKCSPMKYISGDTNLDSKLDVSETWTYTCTSNLTATTTNTAIANGTANGYSVRDIAIATVVVATAAPALPNTGFTPVQTNLVWGFIAAGLSGASLFFVLRKKQTA